MTDNRHGKLQDKVALVTGAGRGIGRGIALVFAAEGAHVAVNYSRSAAAAEEVVELIRARGRRALAVQADVSQRAQVERMFAEVLAEFGRVDILVNNAGLQIWKPAIDITEAEWDETLDVDLKGTFLCMQLAARDMIRRGQGGKIINITSIQDTRIVPPHVNYHAAKAGQAHLTRSFALELAPYHINVNAIGPGATRSAMAGPQPGDDPEIANRPRTDIPWGRIGEPEDIGRAAAFLASDDADYITGQVLHVDGGLMLK